MTADSGLGSSAGSSAGPHVVAIGGGHGLAATLRACRTYAGRLTAVVSTADDGGSTGRLRRSWDVPAPGDVRRCLSALGAEGSVWSRLLERRFDAGELDGHAVGNLLLLALTEEMGSLQGACDELARLCGLGDDRVRIVPVTDDPVVLCGTAGGVKVEGQVAVAGTRGIDQVWVEPLLTAASPVAVDAILDADQVVLGPGSLYTSVLAAAVVGDLRKALTDTGAHRTYVCNLRSEIAEARGYSVADHLAALARHGIVVDVALCQPDALPTGEVSVRIVEVDVARPHGLAHDPGKLGAALAGLVTPPRPRRD